jgi:hypothetical protein
MADNNSSVVSWEDNDKQGRADAFETFSDAASDYSSVARSNHRSFLDIEPNRSVKTGFSASDYYAFRPNEEVPTKSKGIIKMSMDAYDKVGIVKNVIDLMGDFGCQGIQVVHENKSAEKLFQQWFKKVDGKERSERFLNNLYRCGQTFIYRSYANVTPAIRKYMKSLASDILVEVPVTEADKIPWRYNFFNPLTIELKDGDINLFLGQKSYEINASRFFDNFKDTSIPAHVIETLPVDIKEAINQKKQKIKLDNSRLSVFYYKKDDWQQWAHPLVYAILDDIVMLEKMKLADLAALDGAISNIRLWTLGNFEYKVLPTKAGINKVRNILAGNTGGGTMELVFGPELKFTESNSQVYKFLGSEKYQSVLNSIYAGLGVPPTLTGMAGQSGGFTNNFISLKTLVERLQYGRDQLTKFWEGELEIVRRALGIRKSAYVVFDQMSLSDESTEKNLLVQLADRDIISHETVLERFKEVPSLEKVRLKREYEARNKDKLPDKASPFHNANHDKEIEKIEKQGKITEKISQNRENKPNLPNGRPPFKGDTTPRKKRIKKPKTKPGVAELVVWATSAFDAMQILSTGYLKMKSKSNLRALTKAEIAELEDLKLDTFLSMEPMGAINNSTIYAAMNDPNRGIPEGFAHIRENSITLENYRKVVVGVYVETVLSEI